MKKLFFVLAMFFTAVYSMYSYTESVSEDLYDNLIRLHILARSNSDEDQKIKLAVRDKVIESVSEIPITDTEKFLTAAEACANEYLSENNIPYRAEAKFGTFFFPRKSYGNITLPAGKYKGVRILLDEGKGRNWWCVMYPPLCASGKSREATEVLAQSLSGETYTVITQKPEIKFKIIELFSGRNF